MAQHVALALVVAVAVAVAVSCEILNHMYHMYLRTSKYQLQFFFNIPAINNLPTRTANPIYYYASKLVLRWKLNATSTGILPIDETRLGSTGPRHSISI